MSRPYGERRWGLGHSWEIADFALAFGVVGGITSELQGGNFGHGFLSAGLGAIAGFHVGGIEHMGRRILASSVVGGTISEITGGKFANGALSAAFASATSGLARLAQGDHFAPTKDISDTAAAASATDAEIREAMSTAWEMTEKGKDSSDEVGFAKVKKPDGSIEIRVEHLKVERKTDREVVVIRMQPNKGEIFLWDGHTHGDPTFHSPSWADWVATRGDGFRHFVVTEQSVFVTGLPEGPNPGYPQRFLKIGERSELVR